jgi:hypothetical protein
MERVLRTIRVGSSPKDIVVMEEKSVDRRSSCAGVLEPDGKARSSDDVEVGELERDVHASSCPLPLPHRRLDEVGDVRLDPLLRCSDAVPENEAP